MVLSPFLDPAGAGVVCGVVLLCLKNSTLQRELQDGIMHKSCNVNLCSLYTLQRGAAVVYSYHNLRREAGQGGDIGSEAEEQ